MPKHPSLKKQRPENLLFYEFYEELNTIDRNRFRLKVMMACSWTSKQFSDRLHRTRIKKLEQKEIDTVAYDCFGETIFEGSYELSGK